MSENEATKQGKTECGIIMPISEYGSYAVDFWKKIRLILDEAITAVGMVPHPVWEDDKTDIIHAKIVTNIATLPVVIGVIIGNNPNVMLECGMRLWTNLPLLLIYGDGEKIPFDVGSISCLKFPQNFEYFRVVELKDQVIEKLKQLTGAAFKGFKSYYSLPAEVEEPQVNQKIDFKQFVLDMRSSITSLAKEVRSYNQRLTDVIVEGSPGLGRNNLSGDSSCYQAGATGPSGPFGGYYGSRYYGGIELATPYGCNSVATDIGVPPISGASVEHSVDIKK